ncbi:MAG: prenyltransferase/squalene oxidase repeat-containing protein [Pirellulaceae bacterium]
MHYHRNALWGLLLLGAALTGAACREHPATTARPQEGDPQEVGGSPESPAVRVPAEQLQAAIDRSAHYLAGLCDASGRFAYRTHLDPQAELRPAYNVLRHAGAVYALAQYCQRSRDPEVCGAMRRAAEFLRRECLGPVAGNANLLAVWSDPEMEGHQEPRQAKLGGAGLALIALLSVERVEPGSTPLAELQAVGRFLIFMQKSDGRFFSKYFPDTGRSDAWQSDYYPGEAALGLLMLHVHDPAPQWLATATKALQSIAERGAATRPTFPDQWFLLATEQMMQQTVDDALPISRDVVVAHARQTSVDMLDEQQRQIHDVTIRGCYTPDGRCCPTATRLEGLLAAQAFLPASDAALSTRMRQSIELGMGFLLRCQIVEGPNAGAVPRVMPGFAQPEDDADRERAGEVRIDYVQHALSAMMRFEAEFCRGIDRRE